MPLLFTSGTSLMLSMPTVAKRSGLSSLMFSSPPVMPPTMLMVWLPSFLPMYSISPKEWSAELSVILKVPSPFKLRIVTELPCAPLPSVSVTSTRFTLPPFSKVSSVTKLCPRASQLDLFSVIFTVPPSVTSISNSSGRKTISFNVASA